MLQTNVIDVGEIFVRLLKTYVWLLSLTQLHVTLQVFGFSNFLVTLRVTWLPC